MSRVESRPVVESIEHLDFAPPCGNSACNNPAVYMGASVCGCQRLVCSTCVAEKIAKGEQSWKHAYCGRVWGRGPWLDFVTLHPLGGAR